MLLVLFACVTERIVYRCPDEGQDSGIVEQVDGRTTPEDTAVDSGDSGDPGPRVGCDGGGVALDAEGFLEADATWCPQDTIVVHGRFEVATGVTLTIFPGTTVYGTYGDDGTSGRLVVQSGARIEAQGTQDDPIVLTALTSGEDPAEWEGLLVYGDAPRALYTEGDAADSSGTLRYLRVEYGGYVDAAIQLVGVGSGTEIDYVASVSSGDDGFEFDGGTVEAEHLVVKDCADDGFQTEDGFTGSIHHSLVERCSGSGITVRNRDPDDEGTGGHYDEPRTFVTAWNLTFLDTYSEGAYFDNGGQGELANILVEASANCALRVDDASALEGNGAISLHHALLWDADENWCPTDDGFDVSVFASSIVEEDPLLDDWIPDADSPALDADNADTDYDIYLGAFEEDDDWTEDWSGEY